MASEAALGKGGDVNPCQVSFFRCASISRTYVGKTLSKPQFFQIHKAAAIQVYSFNSNLFFISNLFEILFNTI